MAECITPIVSVCAEDFLTRLNYLLDNKIDNILTDNGSEFQKYFERVCQKLNLNKYYGKVRQPKIILLVKGIDCIKV